MIEHNFYRSVGSKAVGSSEIRFQTVVESLHGTEGYLTARLEPAEDERLVRAKHARDFLHRLETGAQGLRAPLVHELCRPRGREVFPEELELLLQEVGADGAQVAGEQLLELDGLLRGEVLGALQQTPSRVGEDHLLTAHSVAGADLARLLRPHIIDRLVHLGGDVIAIEDVERAGCALGDYVQIRLPHVRADKADERGTLGPQPQEELPQARLLAILRHEQQPLHPFVDLVDEREESALAPVDLIDSAGADAGQVHPCPAPVHRHLHRAEHALPAGLEGPRDILPGQQLRPGGQEPRKARRQRPLAHRPGQVLDHDPVLAAVHPPRRVTEVGRDPPQRHELKLPLGQPVVAGRGFLAMRAGAPGAFPGPQLDLDPRHSPLDQSARLVYKALQPLHVVQESLQHKMHRQFRSAKLPPWESSAARSSPRTRPLPRRANVPSAAAPPSSASSPPTRCTSPGSSPVAASMSTASRWTNAVTAAPSPQPKRGRRRSNAARRLASSSSARTCADGALKLDVLPSCASPGRASWHLRVPRLNCVQANNFTHKFCGRTQYLTNQDQWSHRGVSVPQVLMEGPHCPQISR